MSELPPWSQGDAELGVLWSPRRTGQNDGSAIVQKRERLLDGESSPLTFVSRSGRSAPR